MTSLCKALLLFNIFWYNVDRRWNMKKSISLLLILIMTFILTGCTAVRIDTDSIDNTINVVLSKNNKLYNQN